jgi:alpha-glucosidase (family GH31 glycosyl hydrolase)
VRVVTSLTHTPLGSGHPYRIDPDQRHPVHPIAGEGVQLRVRARRDVSGVDVEILTDDGTTMLPLERVDVDAVYPVASTQDGHLAAASGARPDIGDDEIWTVTFDAPRAHFTYRFHGAGGVTDWFDGEPVAWSSSGGELRIHGGSGPKPADVRWLTHDRGPVRCRFTLPLAPDEHVVGFGERFHSLDQRGHRLDARVFEQYKQQGLRTYLPSPFAVVVTEGAPRAWGVHIDTSRVCDFDVGRTEATELVVEVDVDPDHPIVDVHLSTGSPRDVIAAHVERVGGLVRPPDWVFQPWMSANEWNTQARVLSEVERSIELDIPVGVVVIEAWSDEATFVAFNDAVYEPNDGAPMTLADFTFPADGAWPDPRAMVERLHDLEVKILLWQIPIVPTDRDRDISPIAATQVAADAAHLVENGLCVREADGSPYRNRGWWFPGGLLPDWTNPETREWWTAKRRYLLEELGIDGFKTDGGEHAWGDELRYHDGTCGATTNNLFANQYAEAYHQLMRSTGTDGITFSRAGFTGAGAVPCHWAGDEDSTWEAFRASITAGLTAAVSGIPFWGWDIAGFSGDIPTVELWARASAMGALCPIMQYHAEYNHGRLPSNDRTPWNLAERHDDQRAITIYRRYAQLRQRLLPYIRQQADVTVRTGVPLMRPLFVDHAEPGIWAYPYEYMFGNDLLVAPVCWEALDELEVYLPSGDWVDVWTGDAVTGDRTVMQSAPLDRIPVYARRAASTHLVRAFQAD